MENEQSQPRKRGRPRKDKAALLDSGEHWADALVRIYSDGGTDVEVCKALGMTHKSFMRREKDDDQFASLVEFGRLSSKAFWLSLGRTCAKNGGKGFNWWKMWMQNQYGWSDKAETSDGKTAKEMSADELKAEIKRLMDKVKKTPANAELQALGVETTTH